MEDKVYLVEGYEASLNYETYMIFAVCTTEKQAKEYLAYLIKNCQRGEYWVSERKLNVLAAPPEYRDEDEEEDDDAEEEYLRKKCQKGKKER